jgi:hypothetical protein
MCAVVHVAWSIQPLNEAESREVLSYVKPEYSMPQSEWKMTLFAGRRRRTERFNVMARINGFKLYARKFGSGPN